MVRTVGIDLSLTGTGIAHSGGACRVIGRLGITTLAVDNQIAALDELADEIMIFAWPGCGRGAWSDDRPVAVCIEGLDMAQSYGGQIERTVLWWDVVRRFRRAGITVLVAPSPQVKMYATGKGSGPKGAVIEAVTRRWPQFDHLGNDNAADAAVCAAIAHHMVGAGPILPANWPDGQFFEMPASHTRALISVRSTEVPPPVKKRPPRRGTDLTRKVAPDVLPSPEGNDAA